MILKIFKRCLTIAKEWMKETHFHLKKELQTNLKDINTAQFCLIVKLEGLIDLLSVAVT
ncbi:hypothetical protein D3C83_189360 [compost metagenome]